MGSQTIGEEFRKKAQKGPSLEESLKEAAKNAARLENVRPKQ